MAGWTGAQARQAGGRFGTGKTSATTASAPAVAAVQISPEMYQAALREASQIIAAQSAKTASEKGMTKAQKAELRLQTKAMSIAKEAARKQAEATKKADEEKARAAKKAAEAKKKAAAARARAAKKAAEQKAAAVRRAPGAARKGAAMARRAPARGKPAKTLKVGKGKSPKEQVRVQANLRTYLARK